MHITCSFMLKALNHFCILENYQKLHWCLTPIQYIMVPQMVYRVTGALMGTRPNNKYLYKKSLQSFIRKKTDMLNPGHNV